MFVLAINDSFTELNIYLTLRCYFCKKDIMKVITYKNIAFIIAILGAILQSIGFVVVVFFNNSNRINESVLFVLITFVLLFATSYYLVIYYIRRKIQPIYKAIQTSSTSTYDKFNNDLYVESNIISSVSSDVTDWIQDKKKEIDVLKKQETYRKEYIGNVSHELKTPIFNIQGYIETLIDGGMNDSEINTKYLERASKAVDRMISIVEDLETISGLEAGNLVLNYENFDFFALCNEVIDAQEMLAKSKNIRVILKTKDMPALLVSADRKRISQVVTNLVVNSIKYGIDGGVTKIKYYDMESSILVEIKDNGIGIGQEDLKRVFERFYRVDKSRSRSQGGTGLGLSIVKHIIEAHNQTINVKSEPQVGTSFTFTINKAQIKK